MENYSGENKNKVTDSIENFTNSTSHLNKELNSETKNQAFTLNRFKKLKSDLQTYRGWELKISFLLLFISIAFFYFIRAKFFLIPFERDEGIYAYFGKLILDGKIPYKDFYEVKFPGLFYSYAFMIKLFGYDLKSLHFGFTIINLINTILIFFISLKFFRPAISLFTSIMFSIYSLNPDMSGFTIQAEHLVSFFISLGIYFILSNEVKNSNFKIFLSGIFLSFAVMIKTAAFSIILFVTIYFIFNLFYKKNKLKRSKILFNILYFSLGCAFTVISFLFLIILKGSLSEMIYFTFKMSSRYITQINFSQGFLLLKGEIIRIIDNHKLFWFISILGFCVLFIQKIQPQKKIFLVLFGILSFLMVLPGFYFYGHYFLLIIPAATLLFANFIDYSIKFCNRKNLKLSFISISLLIILCFTNHFFNLKAYYFNPNYSKILRSTYGNNPFPEAMEVGKFLKKNLKQNETFALIGSEPELFVYANRNSLSKHAYFTAIVNNVPEHHKWQREFTSSIEKVKPQYFIYFNNPISLFIQPKTDDFVFKWANNYIKNYYKLVGLVDIVSPNKTIYKWNNELLNYIPTTKDLILIYQLKN